MVQAASAVSVGLTPIKRAFPALYVPPRPSWSLLATLLSMFTKCQKRGLLYAASRPSTVPRSSLGRPVLRHIVNAYPGDVFRRKSYRDYAANAKQPVVHGLAKHKGSIAGLVSYGSRIVLPSSLTDWVKMNLTWTTGS
ncbi:hypothetical protein E4U53_001508 [Claviceps sorghi]|nr:hypothetical protein E4U53_001508 [Claviceps sorghi]